jgi:hypothetical protein
MPDENIQQSALYLLRADPFAHFARDFVKAIGYSQLTLRLGHAVSVVIPP